MRRALEANAQAMLEVERSAAAGIAKKGRDHPTGANPRGKAVSNRRERIDSRAYRLAAGQHRLAEPAG